jgi:hypothetical protein
MYVPPPFAVDVLFKDGGTMEASGAERGEGQLNENGPEGAGLVLDVSSSLPLGVISGVDGTLPTIPGTTPFTVSSGSTDLLAFVRRRYPPSLLIVALGTRQPVNLPAAVAEEGPVFDPNTLVPEPGLDTVLPSTVTLPSGAFEVALRGILRFFLLLVLESSRLKVQPEE